MRDVTWGGIASAFIVFAIGAFFYVAPGGRLMTCEERAKWTAFSVGDLAGCYQSPERDAIVQWTSVDATQNTWNARLLKSSPPGLRRELAPPSAECFGNTCYDFRRHEYALSLRFEGNTWRLCRHNADCYRLKPPFGRRREGETVAYVRPTGFQLFIHLQSDDGPTLIFFGNRVACPQ